VECEASTVLERASLKRSFRTALAAALEVLAADVFVDIEGASSRRLSAQLASYKVSCEVRTSQEKVSGLLEKFTELSKPSPAFAAMADSLIYDGLRVISAELLAALQVDTYQVALEDQNSFWFLLGASLGAGVGLFIACSFFVLLMRLKKKNAELFSQKSSRLMASLAAIADVENAPSELEGSEQVLPVSQSKTSKSNTSILVAQL